MLVERELAAAWQLLTPRLPLPLLGFGPIDIPLGFRKSVLDISMIAHRVSRFLTEKGFYETWDFFDSFTWYPLGRVVGGTMYPGAAWVGWHVLYAVAFARQTTPCCAAARPTPTAAKPIPGAC